VIEPPDLKSLDSAAKDALILALIDRINVLDRWNAELKERVARLEAKLGHATEDAGDNSSLPPSQGHKASRKRRASRKASRTGDRTGNCILIRPARSMCGRRIVRTAAADVSTVVQTRPSVTIASSYPRSSRT